MVERAGAQLAQHIPGVDTVAMPIAPDNLQSVIAHQFDRGHVGVKGRQYAQRIGVLTQRFALGTGAMRPQIVEGVGTLVPIAPTDAQFASGAVEDDVSRANAGG